MGPEPRSLPGANPPNLARLLADPSLVVLRPWLRDRSSSTPFIARTGIRSARPPPLLRPDQERGSRKDRQQEPAARHVRIKPNGEEAENEKIQDEKDRYSENLNYAPHTDISQTVQKLSIDFTTVDAIGRYCQEKRHSKAPPGAKQTFCLQR